MTISHRGRLPLILCHHRTASAIKIKRMQGPSDGSTHHTAATDTMMTNAGFGFGAGGVGIDMASDAADESADRALTSVRRKLDQSLSVEYTVNELITTATDPTNLAQIFFGEFDAPTGFFFADRAMIVGCSRLESSSVMLFFLQDGFLFLNRFFIFPFSSSFHMSCHFLRISPCMSPPAIFVATCQNGHFKDFDS